MDNNLIPAIIACKYNGKTYNIGNYTEVFMYVKDYCPHSKAAAKTAYGICDTYCFEVQHNKFLDPATFEVMDVKNPVTPHIVQAYKCSGLNTDTVPQIFVKVHGGWHWVGGNVDFKAYNTEHMTTGLQSLKM